MAIVFKHLAKLPSQQQTLTRFASYLAISKSESVANHFRRQVCGNGHSQHHQKRSMSMLNKLYRATSFPIANSCTYVGRRDQNEDRLVVSQKNNVQLFAVLDGHGGTEVVDLSRKTLEKAFRHNSHPLLLRDLATFLFKEVSEAVNAYLDVHQDCRGGTTLAIALRRENELVAAHVGDSKVAVFRGHQKPRLFALTDDHRPEREDEVERITRSGGEIHWTGPHGRVNGQLAMTRAIGARYMQEYGVIDLPEITSTTLTNDDYLLLLATDGLFDFTPSKQIEYELSQSLQRETESEVSSMASQKLVDASQWNRSKDNVTCLVAPLPGLSSRSHDIVPPAPFEDIMMLRRM